MTSDLLSLLLASAAYLSLLFSLAQATERGWIPQRIVHHPLTYTLSLGVYAGAWAVYGSVGMAFEYGYGYLAYYLGVCGAFLLAPVMLSPVLRITRAYQLTSLADLFAFRYRSQLAGTLVTLCSAAAVLSLLSLQIKAVVTSMSLLAPQTPPELLGVLFSLMVMLFGMLFGARRRQGSDSHDGLVMAIAFDSLVKLLVLLLVGGVLLMEVFGSPQALDVWLREQAGEISALEQRLGDGAWRALLLMSFAAALVMPHMFHMTFTENTHQRSLAKASWGLPLYLLLLSLPVPMILWAGIELNVDTRPEYFILGALSALDAPALRLLAYVAGTAAASGLMIVLTLALAGMVLNHIVLPLRPPRDTTPIYDWLRWVKRLLIALIILAALIFHATLGAHLSLATLGILALSGVLQLLPGALGVIYWPEGNRQGVLAGLSAGILLWLLALVFPLTFDLHILQALGIQLPFGHQPDDWFILIFTSLSVNVGLFALVSVLTRTSSDEASAAQACSMGTLSRPQRRELIAASSEEFKRQLAIPLGAAGAEREVQRALDQLALPSPEYRPYQLRRLRDQIEVNLSGLLGPGIARDMVKRHLGLKPGGGSGAGQDIHYVERALEDYQTRLTGLAGELDSLRRHYRQTLQNLPIAACSVGHDGEVLMWNQAMEALTGIDAGEVIGATLEILPPPWNAVLGEFSASDDQHRYKHRIDQHERPHWFNLHKSVIGGPDQPDRGTVILMEDQTEVRLLEDELIHSERLASVGRLAAGVAHEIGNPVTGIACLAQNLKLETDDEEILDSAEQILVQTRRISRILQTLMNFSRSGNHTQSHQHGPTELRRCVQEAINLLSLSDREQRVRYENACPEDLIVTGDEQRLVQVFINLLSNARDASPEGGTVRVSGQRESYFAMIDVLDEGCGIPADQLDHVFEPFYTTKATGQGTGLGLSLVYSIIEEHYGSIQIDSPLDAATGRGTRVSIRLPAHAPQPPGTQTLAEDSTA
ncbi:MAG: PAS domain-containing protein [Gammaproteobacteria bacterium]|nr:PAS domain-containing protein [Gammaproteobacteria bacterium]